MRVSEHRFRAVDADNAIAAPGEREGMIAGAAADVDQRLDRAGGMLPEDRLKLIASA